MKSNYIVTGMTCSACSSRVQKTVSNIKGVNAVNVNLLTGRMSVEYDENIVNDENIIDNVTKAGYGAESENSKKNNEIEKIKISDTADVLKHNFIFSLFFLLPMMYISMNHMIYEAINAKPPYIIRYLFYGSENAITFSFIQFLLLIPVIYINRRYYINGFKNLWHKSPNMDSLIAIGSSAAAVYGIMAIFRIGYGLGHNNMTIVENYSSQLYFESSAMILTLITLGKFFEEKSKKRTSEAIRKLINLAPKLVNVIRDDNEVSIPSKMLQAGDIMIVRSGESIAADGIIIEGTASMDESAITGESMPVDKKIGDRVISASINKNGYVKIKAEKVGEDTTLSKIIRLVEDASSSKAPIAKLADRISGVFVPIVIVIACSAILIWLVTGASIEFALSIGISVLVISCPCALGLATPVAIMVGTGKGAENGILIKSGEALEAAHSIDTVVLDKTGTITKGEPQVTDVINYNISKNELLTIAASIEHGSEHPLAQSIIKYVSDKNLQTFKMDEYITVFGRGVESKAGEDYYIAGNISMLKEKEINTNECLITIEKLADEGKTPMIFAKNNNIIGIVAVADVIKDESRMAVKRLKDMGLMVVMLTGDNTRTAHAIMKQVGINSVIAEVLPDDKERHISKLQKEGHKVAMVGDGINDAPALVCSDLGIAIGAGTDIAIDSADVVLMKNELTDVVNVIKLSKAVIRNIKENLFWAFFYNSIGIPLAAGVWYNLLGLKLNPMVGAAAMSLSSVCVVLNALRLKFFKKVITDKSYRKENEIMQYEIKIEGMMCEHCSKRVHDAIAAINGVNDVVVELDNKKAIITANEELDIKACEKAVTDAGYTII